MKMCPFGLMSTSQSRLPAGTTIRLLSPKVGSEEPHDSQKDFANRVPVKRNVFTWSLPVIHVTFAVFEKRFAQCAVPVTFWHLEQWQRKNPLNSPVTSNVIRLQRHEPEYFFICTSSSYSQKRSSELGAKVKFNLHGWRQFIVIAAHDRDQVPN